MDGLCEMSRLSACDRTLGRVTKDEWMSSNDPKHIESSEEKTTSDTTVKLPGKPAADLRDYPHVQASRPGYIPPPRTPPPIMTPPSPPSIEASPQSTPPPVHNAPIPRSTPLGTHDAKTEESLREQARSVTRDNPLEKNFPELVAAHQARVRQNNFFLDEPIDPLEDTIASSDSNPVPLDALLAAIAEEEDEVDHTVELQAGALDLDWSTEMESEPATSFTPLPSVSEDESEPATALNLLPEEEEIEPLTALSPIPAQPYDSGEPTTTVSPMPQAPVTASVPSALPEVSESNQSLDDTMDSVSLNAAITDILEMEPVELEHDELEDTMMAQSIEELKENS